MNEQQTRQARIRIVITLAFVVAGLVAGVVSGSSFLFVTMVAAGIVVNIAMRVAVRRSQAS
jgi:hypothetical protein